MKTRIVLAMILLFFIVGCFPPERITDLRDNATPLRGVVRVGWSLDQNWNMDVWVGSSGWSGRPPSFVLLPQGSMEWEAVGYQGFYLYAEAWIYDQNGKKIVQARIKNPERIMVSRYADRDGYGWSIEIRVYEDGDLYVYQEPTPKRLDIYRPQWGW